MSMIVSTPQQILKSPLNNSTAKMQYSFPKAPRMMLENKSCSHAFYDLPPVRASRTTTFGYGNKYDFTQGQSNNPAPTAYSLKGAIDGSAKKGFSFGLSREQMLVTGGAFVGDKTSPGPGAYDTRETNKVSLAYSFRPRTNSIESHNTSHKVPGPGNYPLLETISPKGKIFVSKYKSAATTVFSPSQTSRFGMKGDGEKPGPGAYNIGNEINPKGSYFLSKFKSSVGRSFGGSTVRKQASAGNLPKSDVPGPGSYRAPSDFGFYESKPSTTRNQGEKGI